MPQPTNPENGRKMVLRELMRAESLMQIAVVLPLSTFIGWGIGDFLDYKLHQSWIAIVGLLLGVVAGFIQVVRIANHASRTDDN
mgnify:FL=1